MSAPAAVVTTYLEIDDPAKLRPSARPVPPGVRIDRVQPPDGATSAWFYREVGRRHRWTDHAARTDAEWQAWAEQVETWVLTLQRRRVGYAELRPDGDVELAYFGLLPAHQGQGLGAHLLGHALARGLELGPRVWLHTCTLDGPHALANYVARGLRPYRRTTEQRR